MQPLKTPATTLVVAIILLSLVSVLPAQAGYTVVRTEPYGPTLSIGQVTTIHIRIDDVTGLAGAEVHLTYNPAILEVLDADPGQLGVQITPGSLFAPIFVAQNKADTIYGTIDFAAMPQPPSPSVSGSGVLASITFRAKAAGSSALTFTTVNLSNPSSSPIPHSLQNGLVVVAGAVMPTVIPPYYPTPVPPYYPTPAPPYPPLPSSILGYHTVRAGESLFCIARAYGVSPWAIASQNNLAYPYALWVGQVLAIPNVPWTNMTAGPTCQPQFTPGVPLPQPYPWPAPTPIPAAGTWYQVQPYDSLYSIAARFGVSVYAIMQANNLSSPYNIYVGQWLYIPAGMPYPPPPMPTPYYPPPPGPYPSEAWLGHYFDNIELGGSPQVQRLDPAIDFDWGQDSPFPGQIHKDFFSVRWTRDVYFEGGTYRFWAWVDDGVRLYVDGRVVINEWHDATNAKHLGDASLSPGVHSVKVEYYDHSYEAMISVWWEKLY